MARVTFEVGTRERYSRQVSTATLLLPVKAMVHATGVTIAGSPAALRLLAEQLELVAEEADAGKAGMTFPLTEDGED